MNSKFKYKTLGGLVNICTLSPNEKYYYRIKKPRSINMSNFGTEIAFYNIKHELLYHRNNCLAHWLESIKDDAEFARWSDKGNLVCFYEYKRDHIYDMVFLDFKNMQLYRLDRIPDKNELFFQSLNLITSGFDEDAIINKLKEYNVPTGVFFKDDIIKPSLTDLIFKNTKWHP